MKEQLDLETILHSLPAATVASFAMPNLKRGLQDTAMRNPEQPIPAMAHWLIGLGCDLPDIRAIAAAYRPKPRPLGWNPSLADIAENATMKRRKH